MVVIIVAIIMRMALAFYGIPPFREREQEEELQEYACTTLYSYQQEYPTCYNPLCQHAPMCYCPW